ncbi:MAG: protein rep [Gemmatimonadales bacterium]
MMTTAKALGTGSNADPAPLDTETQKVSGAGRRKLHQLRDFLRGITKVNRCTKCGHVAVDHVSTVHLVQSSSGQARYSGVMACNSLWLCPVCSDRIARKRARNLTDLLGRWVFARGGLCFQTFTMPHRIGDPLESTVSAVTRAFRGVLAGRAWHRIERKFGVEGHVRVLEATVGPNGWHPHLHVLFFTKAPLSPEQLQALHLELFERFSRTLARRGFDVPDPKNCPLKAVDDTGIGGYVAKVSAAAELTCWHTKLGRRANRSPFQVLHDAMAYGDPRDFALWGEWERTMPGRRQMTWAKGFEKKVRALPAPPAAELAEEDGELKSIARLSHALWGRIRRRKGLDLAALEAVEVGGYQAAARLLKATVGQDLDDFEVFHFADTSADLVGLSNDTT